MEKKMFTGENEKMMTMMMVGDGGSGVRCMVRAKRTESSVGGSMT
jgi:hypothetical protein